MEVIIFKNRGEGRTFPRRFESYPEMVKTLYRYKDSYILMTKPENCWIDWVAFFDEKPIGNFPTYEEAKAACPRAKISPAPEGVYIRKSCKREIQKARYAKYVSENF